MGTQIDSETPLHLTLELADHEALTELLGHVQQNEIPARTKHISEARLSEETTVSIDLDVLTTKQRETLELALDSGYYERPRKSDLSELAAELDVTKSAVSQRLRTAETKLIKYAFGHHK